MTAHENLRFCLFIPLIIALSLAAAAQQTLGSITGTVSDSTGALIQKAEITLVNNSTGLQKTAASKNDGSFDFPDLPIGTYTLTFNHAGFKKEVHNQVLVQANRTTSVLVNLQPGGTETTVEVTGTPLLNRVDTTNGYIMSSEQVEEVPLGTGSFTQLAVLSPGVNADFLGGTDTNAGLGNQSIWANGQRDTSNSLTVNSINASNLFNGKTSSQLTGNRVVLNTGENFLAGGQIQTNTSVYDAIGQGVPSPPQETIAELRVNTSMYDATQGANSGAHIEVATRSGTNAMHGQIYGYRQTDALNAAPYFFNFNNTLSNPGGNEVPALHRGIAGGTIGGPILKNKLFYFASYQWTTVSDALGGVNNFSVPTTTTGLTNDRSQGALLSLAQALNHNTPVAALDPVAVQLLQFKLPNGQFLIPTSNRAARNGNDGSLVAPPSTFIAHQASGNLDYNLSSTDQLFFKSYFQNTPTTTPFTNGDKVAGFPEQLLADAETASLQNVLSLSPALTWDQKIGLMHQKVFATAGQPLTPAAAGINLFGSQQFPGISIRNTGDPNASLRGLTIGPTTNFANTGVAQNQLEFGSNLTWVHGRHTLQFGGNFDYLQLNVINLANQVANIGFNNFLSFMTGNVNASRTTLFAGATSRYYRANQAGMYASDKVRLTKTLNVTLGLRYDWDGPLSEVNGNLINFDPTKYQFNQSTDTIVNDGLVVAGNNKQAATSGTSDSTLTGRQWGIAPRLGIAWSPSFVKNVVVRAGFGMYYDRGEFFTEFSPTAGGGIEGPFGATLQPPSVVRVSAPSGATFANPFGTTAPAPGQSFQSFAAGLPNLAALAGGAPAFEFGGYDPRNKLPYSENWNLDIQWQPVNDWALTAAYIGNKGVRLVEPIPFNQPGIATPQHPINGETFSYGYNVPGVAAESATSNTGGNVDLRVPFVGLDPNSVLYQANGISTYNALQLQATKRFSHGFSVNTSYTYSHTLDEGSALGLFFNGNNALNLRENYGSSDFDRTHVLSFNYVYRVPKIAQFHGVADKLLNGWGFSGITTFQSGQPYAIIDFSGAVGSIFYSNNDFITNPILPLAPGFTPSSALTGHTGAGGTPANPITALNPLAFAPQFLQPGQDGVPPCDPVSHACDNSETAFSNNGRNLFRGPFQKRADLSIFKDTAVTERVHIKYSLDIFNLTNTPSFDTPNNNISYALDFGNPPTFADPTGAAPPPGRNVKLGAPPDGNLGAIENAIGSPRLIRMAIHVIF